MNTFNQFSSPKVSFALSSFGEFNSLIKKETQKYTKLKIRKYSQFNIDDQITTCMYTPNDSLFDIEHMTINEENIKDQSISTVEKVLISPFSTENYFSTATKGSIFKFNGGCLKNKAFKKKLNFEADMNEEKLLPVIPEKERMVLNFN